MKFSMIFEAQIADPSRQSEHQVFHECVEQSLRAEQLGFDGIWAVEHTSLTQYAHMNAPETFLAFMAGATFYAQHAVFEQANGGISWSNSLMVKVGF